MDHGSSTVNCKVVKMDGEAAIFATLPAQKKNRRLDGATARHEKVLGDKKVLLPLINTCVSAVTLILSTASSMNSRHRQSITITRCICAGCPKIHCAVCRYTERKEIVDPTECFFGHERTNFSAD